MTHLLASLHTATLEAVASLVMLLSMLAAAGLWRMSLTEHYVRYWTAGYALICGGLMLAAGRDLLGAGAILVGNPIVAVGGALVVNGTVSYCDTGARRWPVAAIGIVMLLAFVHLIFIYPSLRLRVALMAFYFLAVTLRVAWLLWHYRNSRRNNSQNNSQNNNQNNNQNNRRASSAFMQRALALLLLLQAGYYGVMASTVLVPPAAQLFSDAPAANNAIYLNAIMMFVLLLFGFTGLAHGRLQERLQHAAHHDALTGALNRRALDHVLASDLAIDRAPGPLSVVMLDLDHFKRLNDRFGHAAGDAALVAFADVARANLRRHDLLGRMGGEEFCVILPDTDAVTAALIAERIRRAVADIALPEAPGVRLTVSAGVATEVGAEVARLPALLHRADKALYSAKDAGRDRVIAAQHHLD